MKRIHGLFFAALAAAGTAAAAAPEVKLAENGRALVKIALPERATKAARFAAAELKWHLDRITGGDFAVTRCAAPESGAIRVGFPEDAADLSNQWFRVRVDAARALVVLAGPDAPDYGEMTLTYSTNGVPLGRGWPGAFDRQGTMYAAYGFLERDLGVRWVDPTEFGTVLPDRPTLAVAAGETVEKPFFRGRGGTMINHYAPYMWKRDEPGYADYVAAAFPSDRTTGSSRRLPRVFNLRHRAGGDYGEANHSLYNFYDRFLKERPDYFAKGYEGTKPPQLCYTNPDVIRQVIADARYYFDCTNRADGRVYRDVGGSRVKRWGEDVYCLEPMDNSSFCRCERCRALYEPERAEDSSDQSTCWFTFVKRVAEAVAESHPGRRISTLGYMAHEGVPTGVELPDNVIVNFCPFHNRAPFASGYRRQFARMLEWRRKYPDRELGFWLYNTFPLEFAQNAGYHCLPGHISRAAERQYRFFASNRVDGVIFQCGLNGEADGYLQYEWMVDPLLPREKLLDDFFSQYGAAAKPMREFYDLVEERYVNPAYRPKGMNPSTAEMFWRYLCPKEILDRLAALVAEAERLAATELERKRLAVFKLNVWRYVTEGFDDYARRNALPVPDVTAPRVADAGGDPSRVDWNAAFRLDGSFYQKGSTNAAPVKYALRAAHDGAWLYLELACRLRTADLVSDPVVWWADEVELMLANERRAPYRCVFNCPNGKYVAASFYEVDYRRCVMSEQHATKNYSIVYVSDVSAPDVWRLRWAIPFDRMLPRRVKSGDVVYAGLAAVLSGKYGPNGRCNVYPLVPSSGLHVTDRMFPVRLGEK